MTSTDWPISISRVSQSSIKKNTLQCKILPSPLLFKERFSFQMVLHRRRKVKNIGGGGGGGGQEGANSQQAHDVVTMPFRRHVPTRVFFYKSVPNNCISYLYILYKIQG